MLVKNINRSPDENTFFSEDEFAVAYARITDPEEARSLAKLHAAPRDPDDDGPTWELAPDVLDLLSLVSDDCAERVRVILRLTPEEARERRSQAALRFGPGRE